jgi:hypothetical protein
MHKPVTRTTVDLSAFSNLVVIYLGMRVNTLTGIKTVLGLGPQISKSAEDQPDGLLLHEQIFYSFFPFHVGMRQYWRDFESLEKWTRSDPHKQWWQNYLKNSGGTGFWHETYFIRGGMEAIYADIKTPVGFMSFAPNKEAVGSMFSARKRLSLKDDAREISSIDEAKLYE